MRLLFTVLLFVFGCGGNPSGVDNSTQVQVPEDTPVLEDTPVERQIPDVEHLRMYLPEVIPPPDSDTCYKTDENELIDFVDNVLDGRSVSRWMRAPVLKIVEGADNKQRLVVGKAVELLNVSLPDSLNIVIAADQVPPGKYGISDVPDGQIWVEFVGETCSAYATYVDGTGPPSPSHTHVFRPNGTTENLVWTPPHSKMLCPSVAAREAINQEMRERCRYISEDEFLVPGGCAPYRYNEYDDLVASRVLMKGLRGSCYDDLLITMVHELLHALGISGHIETFGFRSVMRDRLRNNCRFEIPGFDWWLFIERDVVIEMDVMYPIDRDALKAVYSLENGDYANELRIEESQICE